MIDIINNRQDKEDYKKNWAYLCLVLLIVFSAQLPEIFLGLYVRDEGRELTLAKLTWEGVSIWRGGLKTLSWWLAGGIYSLAPNYAVLVNRIAGGLANAIMVSVSFFVLLKIINKKIAFYGCLLTFLSVFHVSVMSFNYRTIPSLFVYLAVFVLALAIFEIKHKNQYLLYIVSILIGLSICAKIPYILAILIIPFACLYYFHQNKHLKYSEVIIHVLVSVIIWLCLLLMLQPDENASRVLEHKRFNLSLASLLQYGMSLFSTYQIALKKTVIISLDFCLISTLCTITIFWRKYNNYLAMLSALCGMLIFSFIDGKPGIIAFAILFLLAVRTPYRILNILINILAAYITYRYLSYWGAIWLSIVVVLLCLGNKWENIRLPLAVGAAIYLISSYLGIKYWHTPLGICFILLIARWLISKIIREQLEINFKLWAALGFIVAFCSMLGSGSVFHNTETALFLLLPILLFYPLPYHNLNHYTIIDTKQLHYVFSFGIIIAMSFLSLSIPDSRESSMWHLTQLVDVPKVYCIRTSQGRSKSFKDAMNALLTNTNAGDYMLAYNHVPLAYLVTETYPYLDDPWIDLYNEKQILAALNKRESQDILPTAIIRMKGDSREKDWGRKKTVYSPKGRYLKIKKILDNWADSNKFKIVWDNEDFEVLVVKHNTS